jgi:hypothetical protein
MFVSKAQLSRRTVLRGMGATLALPVLEAMTPAFAATPTRQPVRLVCIEMVHGAAGSSPFGYEQNLWAPAAEGRAFDLGPTSLRALEPFRDYLTIVSNTDVPSANATEAREIGGDHFRSTAVFLTQSYPKRTEGADLEVGTSFDQLYAKRFGHSIDAVGDRGRRPRRRLPVRLFVRVRRFAQLGSAEQTAADGPRSSRGLQPNVRHVQASRHTGRAP